MKLKLAIIYGIITWIISSILAIILVPICSNYFPRINFIVPLISIIVIGFFGILYIRNIDSHETLEGFLVGIVFFIIDSILDRIFIFLPKYSDYMVYDPVLHIISMAFITIMITTFLGYLAQMKIDLQ